MRGRRRGAAERCDGIDNDCNGMTDEGEGLCGAMRVCDRGVCVDRCRAELGCFPGEVCTDRGTCVEESCATVTCSTSQRCERGRCVGACEGIACPRGQTCRAGRCVDPCAGVTCDADAVCVDGVCAPRCECRRCATGQTCTADGRCVSNDCAMMRCAAGQTCVAGVCRDACEGAQCPRGQRCEVGSCVVIPVVDAGPRRDATVEYPDALPPVDVETDAGKIDVPMDVTPPVFESGDQGCGCRAGGGRASRAPALGALALLALLRRRRHRGGR
ncbi:MAG: MopE-related protein [Polyangiales bacterium]